MKHRILINWQGKIEPGKTSEPVHCIDYLPTFIDLAGIEDYEGQVDGTSLVPMIQGKPLIRKEPLF